MTIATAFAKWLRQTPMTPGSAEAWNAVSGAARAEAVERGLDASNPDVVDSLIDEAVSSMFPEDAACAK